MATKTKNDAAWEKLFERYSILASIETHGFYEISADQIREYREPRLMCKFDHEKNLPDIFARHTLGILPVSRNAYVIGHFSLFAKVDYPADPPQQVEIPHHLESLKANELYSESAALHFAYHTGMIDDFVGENTVQTVSGRMGSGAFRYRVQSQAGQARAIDVEGAQIEIDGGYEGANVFALVEAKKEKTADFNVRQLFYPYRVWKNKIYKDVLPIFFTHSNDTFSFFMYQFEDASVFNSFQLVKTKDYIVARDHITDLDMRRLVNQVRFVDEPAIPFPQADSFVKVIDLLSHVYHQPISKDDIATWYDFDKRQADYYSNACRYLGLVSTYRINGDVMISLNEEGLRIMELTYREKYLAFAGKILEHAVFHDVYSLYLQRGEIENDEIVTSMKQRELYNIRSESTFRRRASTIRGWVKWLRGLPVA